MVGGEWFEEHQADYGDNWRKPSKPQLASNMNGVQNPYLANTIAEN